MRAALRPILVASILGCGQGSDSQSTTSAGPNEAEPKSLGAMVFTIEPKGSRIDVTMEAPREKLRGRVSDFTTGELQIDLADLTKTRGQLSVDLDGLQLYRRTADTDGHAGDEHQLSLQAVHARNWLEIGPCDDDEQPETCEAHKKRNQHVTFVITRVLADRQRVLAVTGSRRTVTATVTGQLSLHQHETAKTAELEVSFDMTGDGAERVSVKTLRPFEIDLAEHDIRPRTTFGKLAEKTLEMLVDDKEKLAPRAQLSVAFTARFNGMAKPTGERGSHNQRELPQP